MAELLIDWYDEKSHVFINPKLPQATKDILNNAVESHSNLPGHIWIATSGTEGFPKMIALSKKAMLTSAAAVNLHLNIEKHHPWMNILPLFHAGGVGIHVRALLSGSAVFDFSEKKWDPVRYVDELNQYSICFSSLTPTHVYDIVNLNLRPPKSLKDIIVGGGLLTEALHEKAFALGWRLLKSYGMTETCSQIATALDPDPKSELVLLKHVQLRFTEEEFIEIKSESLLTGYVRGDDPECKFIDPKVDGWYTTQDKGRIENNSLQILGRGANFMKIGGENINFSELESIWEEVKIHNHCSSDVVLIDLPDERLGKIICVAAAVPEGTDDFSALIEDYQAQVIPIAKIRKIYYVEAIPRTELFKLKRNALRSLITDQQKG